MWTTSCNVVNVFFTESVRDFFTSAKFLIYMGHALSTWVSEALTLLATISHIIVYFNDHIFVHAHHDDRLHMWLFSVKLNVIQRYCVIATLSIITVITMQNDMFSLL